MIHSNEPDRGAGYSAHLQGHLQHWNVEAQRSRKSWPARCYHGRIAYLFKIHTAGCESILELGCGQGELLAALNPVVGVGVDLSPLMVEAAQRKHPNYEFYCSSAEEYVDERTFDAIIISDLVNELWDVQSLFEHIKKFCHPRTRLLLNFYSNVWKLPLAFAQLLGLAAKMLPQNWLTPGDMRGLLHLSGYEVVYEAKEVLLPAYVPGLNFVFNMILVRHWPLKYLALTNLLIARPMDDDARLNEPVVSIIVPARNESGNLESLVKRVPLMGARTELVIVEGNSTDDTYEAAVRASAIRKDLTIQVLRQRGKGKADAVRLGFQRATGDILMILDADMTVPPESLPRFVEALASNRAEFVNGVRLVYPMAERAMRFANMIGNKFFSYAFSWLLNGDIKDTLCGTKVMLAKDYRRLERNREYFGEFDPFGDFDLLFGAAHLHLKIMDMPIRYEERTYGTTNISRWRHGLILLRMVAFAARRIKYV